MRSKLAGFLGKISWQTFLQPKNYENSWVVHILHGFPVSWRFVIVKYPCTVYTSIVQHELCMESDQTGQASQSLCTHNQIRRQSAHPLICYKLAKTTNTQKETRTKYLGIPFYDTNRVAGNPPSQEVGAGAPHHAPTGNDHIVMVSRHSRAIAECSSPASVQNSFQSSLERNFQTSSSAKATAYCCCHIWATGLPCKHSIPMFGNRFT